MLALPERPPYLRPAMSALRSTLPLVLAARLGACGGECPAAAGASLTAQVLSSRGFQGVSDPRLHFGGGEAVSAASVRWSGGTVEPLPAAETHP